MTTTRRGYGSTHQQLRAELLRNAYGMPCPRCGKTMLPGQPLDLDHTDDRRSYNGMAHRRCNRSAGGKKGNAARRRRRDAAATNPTSRRW